MNFARRIGKYLPKHIKGPLIQLYRRWSSRILLDKEQIKDLIEFYNMKFGYNEAKLSYDEAICLCKVGWRVNADFWNMLMPKTNAEIKEFYKNVPYYPFELAYWHMCVGQKRFRKEVVNYSFGEVLDYGGGIGDLCVALAKKGLNVTYGDVQGINWEFAKWLFKKGGYDIAMIDLGVSKLPKEKKYHTIICIDTIEHLPNPEVVLEDMATHLSNGGRLIITALNCIEKKEDNPMHLKMDFDAENLLNSFGISKSDVCDWLWFKTSKL